MNEPGCSPTIWARALQTKSRSPWARSHSNLNAEPSANFSPVRSLRTSCIGLEKLRVTGIGAGLQADGVAAAGGADGQFGIKADKKNRSAGFSPISDLVAVLSFARAARAQPIACTPAAATGSMNVARCALAASAPCGAVGVVPLRRQVHQHRRPLAEAG